MLKRSIPDQNQVLVDPTPFPLVYGKTPVLTEGHVSLHDAVESFGSGKLAPKQPDERLETSTINFKITAGIRNIFESDEPDDLRRFFWSSHFQLLPSYMNDEDHHYNRSDWPASASEFEVPSPDIEAMLGCKEYCNMSALPTQEIGNMSTPQGRLITWPSTLQSRFEPATLVDAIMPGHCRFVMLSLVDPYYHVCSTRNAPRQQNAWWAEEVHNILALRRFPLEVAVMITEMTGGWPVSMDEARRHQEQFVGERIWTDRAFTELMDKMEMLGGYFLKIELIPVW
ncbi:hypothetical protein V492_08277 [Pseudogymnoascus sp. VKM F-4246]|nr:hypothetical protein V492_08277 [Pseudogymnoascus sp. VKM F-4246]